MADYKETDSMLTVGDAAHLLHVHINPVRRWSKNGILKAYRIGPRGDRRFRHHDIASFLLPESKIAKVREKPSPFFF